MLVLSTPTPISAFLRCGIHLNGKRTNVMAMTMAVERGGKLVYTE